MENSNVIFNNEEMPIKTNDFHNFKQYDDDDSDDNHMFELPPKRKLIRPPSTSFKKKINSKKKQHCVWRCCLTFASVIFPAVFISALIIWSLVCNAYSMMNISRMKEEILLLQIQLKNVQASEKTSISRRERLTTNIQARVHELTNHHDSLVLLQNTVQTQIHKLDKLNDTVNLILKHTSFPLLDQLSSIMGDIDKMKTGMAETGADIEELKGNQKIVLLHNEQFQNEIQHIEQVLFNVSVVISELENKPSPTLTTTPKTLVVTMQPDEEQLIKRKELTAKLKTLEEKQKSLYLAENEETQNVLRSLKNQTKTLEKAQADQIQILKRDIASLFSTLSENVPSREIDGGLDFVQSTNSSITKLLVKPSAKSQFFAPSSSLNHIPAQNVAASYLLTEQIYPSPAAQIIAKTVSPILPRTSNNKNNESAKGISKDLNDIYTKKRTKVAKAIKGHAFGNIGLDRLLSKLKHQSNNDVRKHLDDDVYRKPTNLMNFGDEYREKRNRGDDEVGFYM